MPCSYVTVMWAAAEWLHAVLQLFVWPAALHRSHSTHIMLMKTLPPLRGFTGGAHCCRGGCSGVDIVHCGCRLVSRYCVLQCCSVSGPRGVAATTTVTARLLAGTGAAAVSGPAGCSACVVCSTATLCTTLSRQAVSTPCTLTSIFRKLGARLLSCCIP